jgi:hypothetical protein
VRRHAGAGRRLAGHEDPSSWPAAFQFEPTTRDQLARVLAPHVVNVDQVVALLEASAGSFVTLRPFDRQVRSELHGLRIAVHDLADRLKTVSAIEDLSNRLTTLSPDVTDLILDRLAVQGYAPNFITRLQDGLRLLDEAIGGAENDLPPKPTGRPKALIRRWFLQNACLTLRSGGIDVRTRTGARVLPRCLRILLAAVREPSPTDMRPLLDEARP